MDDSKQLNASRLQAERQKIESHFNELAQDIHRLEQELTAKRDQIKELSGAHGIITMLLKELS